MESIAIDWNLRVLFWTESVPVPRLRTSSLSGRMVTTLLSEGMKKPKCLTTDPLAGYIDAYVIFILVKVNNNTVA